MVHVTHNLELENKSIFHSRLELLVETEYANPEIGIENGDSDIERCCETNCGGFQIVAFFSRVHGFCTFISDIWKHKGHGSNAENGDEYRENDCQCIQN